MPALKLTKPSCMTVVPGARWAPRRTRSASAIRTPAGTHVVDHAGELVDAVAPAPVPRAPRSRSRVRSKSSTAHGPGWSRRRWRARRRCPSRFEPVRADEPVGEQVQPQVGVGRVGRRGVEVDRPCARRLRRTPRASSSPASAASSAGGRSCGPASPGAPSCGRGVPGVEDRAVSVIVARPWPQAVRCPPAAGSASDAAQAGCLGVQLTAPRRAAFRVHRAGVDEPCRVAACARRRVVRTCRRGAVVLHAAGPTDADVGSVTTPTSSSLTRALCDIESVSGDERRARRRGRGGAARLRRTSR